MMKGVTGKIVDWGAFNHASQAPQLRSSNYYLGHANSMTCSMDPIDFWKITNKFKCDHYLMSIIAQLILNVYDLIAKFRGYFLY